MPSVSIHDTHSYSAFRAVPVDRQFVFSPCFYLCKFPIRAQSCTTEPPRPVSRQRELTQKSTVSAKLGSNRKAASPEDDRSRLPIRRLGERRNSADSRHHSPRRQRKSVPAGSRVEEPPGLLRGCGLSRPSDDDRSSAAVWNRERSVAPNATCIRPSLRQDRDWPGQRRHLCVYSRESAAPAASLGRYG